jgi:hypothetical protein
VKVPRLKNAKEDPNEKYRYYVKCLFDEVESDNDKFSEWESGFIESLRERLEKNPLLTFSEKQQDVIDRLWAK